MTAVQSVDKSNWQHSTINSLDAPLRTENRQTKEGAEVINPKTKGCFTSFTCFSNGTKNAVPT